MEFSGKTAFVTGAANGIGLGICRSLARNGVNLVLADIEQAALEKARSELTAFNIRSHVERRHGGLAKLVARLPGARTAS